MNGTAPAIMSKGKSHMHQRQAYREGLVRALEEFRPAVFVTLVMNRDVPLEQAQKAVVDFCNRVQRAAYGKRWSKYPAEEKMKAYAFPEHPRSNLHWHMVATGPKAIIDALLKQGVAIWAERPGSGYAHIELAEDRRAVARYVTKCSKADWSIANFIVYA